MNDFSGLSTGRYHIIEKLGQGGMAVVYRAFDTSLEMDVAIKFLRMDRITPEMLDKAHKRFKKEAQKTAQLMHANIVQVIDYGEFDGTPFLVMRYVKGGRTLKSVSSGSIPYQRAIGILLPIARALEAAHQKSIIHRDVKPSNILIAEDGTPLLSDFGIAKVLEEEGSGEGLTSTGMALGTPEYMAPEQWEGSKAVDGRADIYSLGVVLYELITGRPPFKADTVPATMVQVLRDPLPRPRKWVPNLPEKVEGVLFKVLAKSPEDRYQSMREFAEAMMGLIADTRSAQAEGTGIQTRPEFTAATVDAETSGLTRDLGGEQLTAAPQPVQFTHPGGLDAPNLMPDSKAKTSDKKYRKSPEKVPQQARTRIKPWQGWALAAVIVIAVIGIIAVTKPFLGPEPGPITPVLPTLTTGLDTPTRQPGPILTATLEIMPTPIPFGAGIFHLGDGNLSAIAYSPDGKTLAAGTSIGIQFYDARTLEKIRFIDTGSWIKSIAFSPDGRRLASGSSDSIIRLWDAQSGVLMQTLEGHRGDVVSVAFSPDGSKLASGSWDYTIKLWDVESSLLQQTLEGHTDYVRSVAFSPNGRWLASGSNDTTIKVWNVTNGQLFLTLKGRAHSVQSIVFSWDGSTMAAGMCYGTIRLWDTANWQLLNSLTNSQSSSGDCIGSIAFSSNGRRLASGSGDKTIRLWDAESGALLHTLEGHTSDIVSVAFSSDGYWLASGADDGTIGIWNVVEDGDNHNSITKASPTGASTSGFVLTSTRISSPRLPTWTSIPVYPPPPTATVPPIVLTTTPRPTYTNTPYLTDLPMPTNPPMPTSTPVPTNPPMPTSTPVPTNPPMPTSTPPPPSTPKPSATG